MIYDLSMLIAIKKDNLIHKLNTKSLKDCNEIIAKIQTICQDCTENPTTLFSTELEVGSLKF